ncbi:MAG TPA: sugar phosphate nucleotidyltransferase [Methanothrix sp.]|nr:sugar phosphate nucleotidyltransferase [Methanothrix sp.]HPJ84647.1 sugar phosphate nucleotidyltransferase [Methanothrix sp.]HPR66423.1 sugar phosphate nucleotidyltransferase [Methanothrix sp.]
MKAVILAAGEGRRCRPLTQTRSKVMLSVRNRPFMEHVIGALAAKGVRDLVVVVGYQKERIMNYFGDGVRYGVNIEYVVQDEQLGTADALTKVRTHVDGPILVVNGDNLVDEQAIEDVLMAEGENVMLAALREHAGDYGVLTVERGKVTKIVEKPGRPCAGILNTGVYRFSPEIFEELPKTPISERGSYELTQTIALMIEEGRDVRAKITNGVWADAIFAWDLLEANSSVPGIGEPKVKGEIEEGAWLRGPVEIGQGSVVRSGSYIVGPVSIGKNCDLGPNVTVLPTTSIGDSVKIGSHTEIRNSIIMNGARIGAGTVVSNSIFGASSSFGDHLIAESDESVVAIEDELHRAEFGAVVADNVIVGGRVLMHPGTMVGAGSKIGSGTELRGWIERGSRVI